MSEGGAKELKKVLKILEILEAYEVRVIASRVNDTAYA